MSPSVCPSQWHEAHATFLFGFRPDWINTLVPGGWSLFCEETFYLFLPLIFSRIRSLTSGGGFAAAARSK